MKRLIVASAVILGATVLVALPGGEMKTESVGLTYEVSALRGKLLREEPTPTERLAVGNIVRSGAVLRTGWWASAELSCPTRGAHFKLEPSTRVRLTDDVPGVLLDLQKGNVRAWFDALGSESPSERLVTTPSAVLAVRGTEYGVSVNKEGDTTIAVFHGVVEVRDLARHRERVMVQAGMFCTVPRGEGPTSPTAHGITAGDFDRGVMPGKSGHAASPGMGMGSDSGTHNQGSSPGMGAGSGSGSGSGGGGSKGGGHGR
ncbi:MAG: FecR domain-containing protein [Acidobacteria bacterium]|nr:FecR domain-containing protein [Acidobacteriota bacterium]